MFKICAECSESDETQFGFKQGARLTDSLFQCDWRFH